MNTKQALLDYTLRIADNALIIGHRCSQWCGHGPVLEQDIALTNIALDHVGQARSLYQYAADQYNLLPATEKNAVFSSAQLQTVVDGGNKVDEDDLAYLRDAWDFKNALLVEQPNHDWAYTVARAFFYDTFTALFYKELQNSKDLMLAAVAEKSVKEANYHARWSSEWVIRLGDGTEESHMRMQKAIDAYWEYSGELLLADEVDQTMLSAGMGVDLEMVKIAWHERIATILKEATLNMPSQTWMQNGGKVGKHTEHLGYILSDMQFMQRAYPGMEW
ncbi:MAG: 1,2-phenylacetyl-CoA epoxidase subunit PaaC [Bacteroidota bacterium]